METQNQPVTTVDTAPHAKACMGVILQLPVEARLPLIRYLFDWATAVQLINHTPPPEVQVQGHWPPLGAFGSPAEPEAPHQAPEPAKDPMAESLAPEPPAPETAVNQDLVNWTQAQDGRGDALEWLVSHLSGLIGKEVKLAEIHTAAVQDGAPIGCPSKTAVGRPTVCDGRLSNCGLKIALQILAADQDFPLVVAKKSKGPWGPTYKYLGFGEG